MGQETLPIYMFYGCYNPINIFYVIFKDGNIATMFVVIFKLMLASFTFYIYLDKTSKAKVFEKSIFSLCYGLSSYFIIYYFNLFYLDGSYFLPITMLFIDRLIKTGKYIPLIFVYSYAFIFSFYSGYIIGIFSLLIVLVISIIDYTHDVKRIIFNVIKLAVSAIVAFLISMFVMFPTIMYILKDNRMERYSFGGLRTNVFDVVGNLFIGQMQSLDGLYPYNYCGIFSVIVLILFLCDKKINIKTKIKAAIIIGFLICCSLFNGLYLAMHMFNAPDCIGHRFAFILSFVILVIAANYYNELKNVSKNKAIIIALAMLGIYYISHLLQLRKLSSKFISSTTLLLEINAFFIAVYLLFLFKKTTLSKKIFNISMAVIVCIEMIVNGYFVVSRIAVVESYDLNLYYAKNLEINNALSQIKDNDNDKFYRIYYRNVLTNNYSQLYDYHSIGGFSTIENGQLHETLYKLGYMTSPAKVIDYGGTSLTRMLFGQKYIINGYFPGRDDGNDSDNIVYNNDYSLSLAYMVPEDVLNVKFEGNNPFVIQNEIASYILNENVDLWSTYQLSIDEESDNTTFYESQSEDSMKMGNYCIMVDDGRVGNYSFMVDAPRENVYGYIELKESKDQSGTSPYLFSYYGDNGLWMESSRAGTPHLTKLGKNNEGKFVYKFSFTEDTDDYCFFDGIDIAYQVDDYIPLIYNELSKNQLLISTFDDTLIEGDVVSTGDKSLLLTSIPYGDYWKVYVDGNSVKTNSALNDTFLAVKLNEGQHHIKFKYSDPNIKTGFILSGLGIVILIILAALNIKNGKIEKNCEG